MEVACIPASPDGSELKISRVGFGCASLMRLTSAHARRELIAAALDAGMTHFDVARMYGFGAAEAALGDSLKGHRDGVTIATKFGLDASGLARRLAPFQAPARAVLARSRRTRTAARNRPTVFEAPRRYDAARAEVSLDTSLRALRVDHVDILFLHDPRPQDEIDGDALSDFLVRARDHGKIRAWGVSADAASGLEVTRNLRDPGVLQMREDLLSPSPPHQTSIGFGSLQWREVIAAWLTADPDARRRWDAALGSDPLAGDELATLLLSSTLARPDVSAVLYSTTQVKRLSIVGQLDSASTSPGRLAAFEACIEADRASILRFAAS